MEFFFQDWKYFGPIVFPFSSNPAVEIQKKHKNFCFTAITKKDEVSSLVVRIFEEENLP